MTVFQSADWSKCRRARSAVKRIVLSVMLLSPSACGDNDPGPTFAQPSPTANSNVAYEVTGRVNGAPSIGILLLSKPRLAANLITWDITSFELGEIRGGYGTAQLLTIHTSLSIKLTIPAASGSAITLEGKRWGVPYGIPFTIPETMISGSSYTVTFAAVPAVCSPGC